jgi:hypothetical protein
MILSETEYAVPSGTHRSRARCSSTRTSRARCRASCCARFAQFKSFGAVYAMLHGGRVAHADRARQDGGAAYAGALLITSTLLRRPGAAAQGNHPAGRDPRPMNTPQFWGARCCRAAASASTAISCSRPQPLWRRLASNIGGPTAERARRLRQSHRRQCRRAHWRQEDQVRQGADAVRARQRAGRQHLVSAAGLGTAGPRPAAVARRPQGQPEPSRTSSGASPRTTASNSGGLLLMHLTQLRPATAGISSRSAAFRTRSGAPLSSLL